MDVVLLDQGNSRWKVATLSGLGRDDVKTGANVDTHAFRDAVRMLAVGGAQVLMSSVAAADVQAQFGAILQSETQSPVKVVRSTDPMPGVRAGYYDNAQLGVDRVLAMVAARAAIDGPCCVVDAGTAATVDFVTAGGVHLGGFILPGLRSFRETLLANTSIPRDAKIEVDAEFGRDTATAVDLGARFAVAGLVALVMERQRQLFNGTQPTVCIGGGDAERLMSLMPSSCFKMQHLVLHGLAVVAASEGH
jgi:type III pantothenate kinase